MNKMKEYKLLTSDTNTGISKQVEEHLFEGWQPFGSPSFIYTPDGHMLIFMQAVVKYE